jgi:hypothetical protein
MKITNLLLLILILVIGCQKIPILTKEKSASKKSEGIVFGKSTMLETKEVKAVSTGKEENKHSTTFRQYIDSDARSNQRISHNIRIGKDYYISGGVNTRQATYGDSVGVDVSLTRYW